MASYMLEWRKSAAALGIELLGNGTRAKCPGCGEGNVKIFVDTVMGGYRFTGKCCKPEGDLIDLVAMAKSTDRAGALQTLSVHTPDLHRTYTSDSQFKIQINQGRQLIEAIWNAAVPLSQGVNSTTFQKILAHRELPFDRYSLEHANNLDKQFRLIAHESLTAALAKLSKQGVGRSTLRRFKIPEAVYVISRAFTLAGQVSALYLFTSNEQRKHVEFYWPIAPAPDSDAGWLIHPDQFASDGQLVVVPDAMSMVKAAFYQAKLSPHTRNHFCAIIDKEDLQTKSSQPLLDRPSLIWAGQPTAKIVKLASTRNLRITSWGYVNGTLRGERLASLNWFKIDKFLDGQSKPWIEYLFEHERGQTPAHFVELVQEAELPPSAIEKIAESLAPEHRDFFVRRLATRSPELVSTSLGSVEQTPKGWVLLKKGKQTLVCNKCWRICEVVYPTHDEPFYVVDILDGETWHRVHIACKKLHENAWRELNHACETLQLSPFSADPKWQTQAIHVCLQFHERVEIRHSQPLGVHGDLLRTSRLEISLNDASMQNIANHSSHWLLPLAGRELPSLAAVQSIIDHAGMYRLVSALVMQLCRHLLGEPELTVLVSGQYARLAQLLLDKTGFLSSNSAIKLCVQDLGIVLSSKDVVAKLQSNMPLWASCDTRSAHWLAAHKPVVYLGSKTRSAPELSDHQLQRITLHLLAQCVHRGVEGATFEQSIKLAWQSLCSQVRIEPPQAYLRPITPLQALARWLSYGITSQTLKLQRKPPSHHSAMTIWCDERSPSFWFYQSAINDLLKRYAMPPWQIAELVQTIAADGAFVEKRKMGRSFALCFKKHILLPSARSILGYKEQDNSENLIKIPEANELETESLAAG